MCKKRAYMPVKPRFLMKRLIPFLFVLAVVMAACEGPVGPIGPQGAPGVPGQDGVNIESFVFEYEDVDFIAPDYSVLLEYPNFTALNSDVTLAYLLWDIVDIDGEPVDVWRALPQTILTEDGMIQYSYDFTKYDTQLFLNTDFDPALLGPIDTDDWIVRLVVVPGKFFDPNGKMEHVDLSDYHAVIEAMGVADKPVTNYNDIVRRN